ncbi:MAG: DMT family transporter [Ilumatobacteraceae bacterium]|nr:DMT family transporter [Ilumatobacteraceae bacterium]
MRKNPNSLGVALIIVSSIGFGLAPTFATFSYRNGGNAVGTLLARFTVATLLMLIVRKVSSRQAKWPRPLLFGQLFLLGALGYFTATILYFTAIQNIDSGLAITIFYCNPVIVVLLSWWLLGNKPSRIIVWCLVSTLIGVTIAAGQVGNADTISVILVLIVAVEYAFYMIISSKVLPKVDLFTGVTIVMFGAASSFAIYALIAPSSVEVIFPNAINGWVSVLMLAVVATVIPTATLYAGMNLIGTGKTAVIQTFEPVASILAGVIFLSEPLTVPRIIGATFVIGAVGVLATAESRSAARIIHQ